MMCEVTTFDCDVFFLLFFSDVFRVRSGFLLLWTLGVAVVFWGVRLFFSHSHSSTQSDMASAAALLSHIQCLSFLSSLLRLALATAFIMVRTLSTQS